MNNCINTQHQHYVSTSETHLKDSALICNALNILCVIVCPIYVSTNRTPQSKYCLITAIDNAKLPRSKNFIREYLINCANVL